MTSFYVDDNKIYQLKKQLVFFVVIDSRLVIVTLFSCHLKTTFIAFTNDRQLNFEKKIHTSKESLKTSIFIDNKTFALNFINKNFVKFHKLLTMILTKFINLKLIDDNVISQINRMTQVKF